MISNLQTKKFQDLQTETDISKVAYFYAEDSETNMCRSTLEAIHKYIMKSCNEAIKASINTFYPVGTIYMSATNINPSTFLGGTWEAWGSGRVPVGVDESDPNFDTVEKTGGASTHTLTIDQMPSHTHDQNSHTHKQSAHSHGAGNGSSYYFSTYTGTRSTELIGSISGDGWEISQVAEDGIWNGSKNTATATATNNATTATNKNTGGDGAHNNLQPYITCYMWKRTA